MSSPTNRGQASVESVDPAEETVVWIKGKTQALFRQVPRPETCNPFQAGSRGRMTLEMIASVADKDAFDRMSGRGLVELAANSSFYAAQLSAYLGGHLITSLRNAGRLRKQVAEMEEQETKEHEAAINLQRCLKDREKSRQEASELLHESRGRIAELEELLTEEQGRYLALMQMVSHLEGEAHSSQMAIRQQEEEEKKEKQKEASVVAARQKRERKLQEELQLVQAEVAKLRSTTPPPSIAELRDTPEFDEDTLEILVDGFEVTKQYLVSRGFLSVEHAVQATYDDLIKSYIPA